MAAHQFYLNRAQRYTYELMPRVATIIGARRLGKTDGFIGPHLCRTVTLMPRGKSALYCATLKQGLTRTIPGTISAIERITGWKHGVHFFVGSHAPKAAGFPEPLVAPYNWEHCIHWFNGHVTHILSQDIKFSANSLTLDAAIIDEARIIKKKKVDEELMPAISGTPGRFLDCPLKKSIYIVTDRPLTREGQWVLDREEFATPEVEAQILQLIRERDYLIRHLYPKPCLEKNLAEINQLRQQCHLFKEYDTIENIAIVGEDYIADMKRSLPPRIFAISILNKRVRRASDGYYAGFDENKHTYVVDSSSQMDDFRIVVKPTPSNKIRASYETFDFKRLQEHSSAFDYDIDPKQSLNIAFDYNANINWVVTGQRGEIDGIQCCLFLSSMFVKNEQKLPELCREWDRYYSPHKLRNNRVNFYFNQTARQKRYANNRSSEMFKDTVVNELRALGWNVFPIDMGAAMFQEKKLYMWDDAFKLRTDPVRGGQKYLYPKFNKDNNEYLIAAIENTETTDKYDGFGKDKSGEKKAENEDDGDLAELRTDGTDAADDLFIGMNFHYSESASSFVGVYTR